MLSNYIKGPCGNNRHRTYIPRLNRTVLCQLSYVSILLREQESNLQSQGHEPCFLPIEIHPAIWQIPKDSNLSPKFWRLWVPPGRNPFVETFGIEPNYSGSSIRRLNQLSYISIVGLEGLEPSFQVHQTYVLTPLLQANNKKTPPFLTRFTTFSCTK